VTLEEMRIFARPHRERERARVEIHDGAVDTSVRPLGVG
jgi:hypothetical protein